MKIHAIIKRERIFRSMTITALSNKARLSKGTISKLENDPKSNPTIGTLKKIARAFNESLAYILEDLE